MGQGPPQPFVPITPSVKKGFFSVGPKVVTMRDGTTPDVEDVCEKFESCIQNKNYKDAAVCLHIIAQNFALLLRRKRLRKKLLHLSEEAFLRIIQSDDLVTNDEYKVFLLLAQWVDHQIETKKENECIALLESRNQKSGIRVNVQGLAVAGIYGDSASFLPPQSEKRSELNKEKEKGKEKEREKEKETEGEKEKEKEREEKGKEKETDQEISYPGEFNTQERNEQEQEEDEAEVDIPDWKFDDEYIEQLKAAMLPHLQHIRFPYFSPEAIYTTEQERLVPDHYIKEAYEFKFWNTFGPDLRRFDTKGNPRLRARKYVDELQWSDTWKGQHIQITDKGKTAKKVQDNWYSAAICKTGYSTGVHSWAIKVNGDETYIGVATGGFNGYALDNYLGERCSYSYHYNGYKNGGTSGSAPYGSGYARGDVIAVLLDMNAKTLTYFKNGVSQGVAFILPSDTYHPAVGWRAGSQTIVSSQIIHKDNTYSIEIDEEFKMD